MVRFLTLFLGLVVGPQTVELEVEAPVERVELHLDGQRVVRLDGPPWTAVVDFPPELAPRVLEARAYDRDATEIDRATLLVNYRRPAEEAILTVDRDADGTVRSGRVLWEARHDREPKAVTVRLDGEKLDVDAHGRFDLPDLEPGDLHVLEATVVFPARSYDSGWGLEPGFRPHDPAWNRRDRGGPGGIPRQRQTTSVAASEATATLAFGGELGAVTTSALSPIPVWWTGGGEPSADAVGLEVDGEPLEVFSVTRERPQLFVVRDRKAPRVIDEAVDRAPWDDVVPSPAPVELFHASRRPVEGFGTFLVLPHRGDQTRIGDLPAFLESPDAWPRDREVSRIWDAIAAAGERAARSDRPRAVLLVLGPEPEDESTLPSRTAVGYLESLAVPFFVWAPESGGEASGDAAQRRRRVFVGPAGLVDLLAELDRTFAGQWIVWVRGRHPPNRVRVAAAAADRLSLVR